MVSQNPPHTPRKRNRPTQHIPPLISSHPRQHQLSISTTPQISLPDQTKTIDLVQNPPPLLSISVDPSSPAIPLPIGAVATSRRFRSRPGFDAAAALGFAAMGSGDGGGVDASISELREKHRLDLENLNLKTQPVRTLQFFIFATLQYLKRSVLYVLRKGGWFMVLTILVLASGFLLISVVYPHEKHVQELLLYFRFVLWWVALGVASSIGLGSGLHTFVLYLGPHIALFTIKAVQCGRVDLKSAPYDTIQLKSGPTWLDKDCAQFGPPIYSLLADSLVRVPLSRILPQVQLEAVLWGLGTALGELPPYFISRAARLSGSKLEAMEELDVASSEDGLVSACVKKIKRWLLTHAQHLNFFTILVLASVPNPLFDLAGIMCGQFGIPFWKFFMATLIGKAIIKTHIQTVFIISVCNNQLLELVENELIWALSHIPGFSSMLPSIIAKLYLVKDKYLSTSVPEPSPVNATAKPWKFSFTLIWNTVVWIMLLNFFVKIVTATAQGHLKRQQDLELKKITKSK